MILAVCAFGWSASTALAQTLYWDLNGNAAGAGTTPTGTWNTSTANWTTSSAGTTATTTYTSGANAIFSAGTNATGTFTVTVSGTQNVGSITIEEGTPTFTGGTINFSDATPDFTVGTGRTATVASIVSGTTGLTKAGAGTLILSGANTFTGATAITAGTVQLQNAGSLGTAANTSNTTVSSGASLQLLGGITTTNAGTLVLSGTGTGTGALQSVSGANMWNSGLSLAANASIFSSTAGQTLTIGATSGTSLFALGSNTVTFDGAGDIWVNSDVGAAGDTGGLIKNGTGKLTLYGYNTNYTGDTFVNAGSMDLIVGPFSNGLYGINGALTIGVGSSNSALAGTVSVNIASNSYANQLGPNANVTINSDGILNVGSSTNLGSLTLNGGQVSISAGKVITPSGSITSNANSAHQTSLISGGQITLSGPTTFTVASDGTLASDLTISSVIAGGALTKQGLGILTLSGANTYTGATTVNAGTLALGASNVIADTSALVIASGATFDLGWSHTETVASLSGAGTLDIKGGPFTVGDATNTTFSGAIIDSGGFGSLVKQGSGTLTLSGTNTYSGATTVNAGVLDLQSSSALGASTFGNTVANGAAVQLSNNISVTEGSFTISGTGVGSTGAIRNTSGTNTLNTALTLGASSSIGADAGTLTVNGDVTLGTGQSLTSTGAGNVTLNGAINGASDLVKSGSGTLTLGGTTANSYSGTTTVNDGTLQLNKTAGTNALAGGAITVGDGVGAAGSANLSLLANNQIADYAGTITLNSDGRLSLNGHTESINTIAGTGSINLGTGGYLGIGANSGSSTFGGSLTGTGIIEKLGSGSLTFNSTISFAGELRLTSGTLVLAGIGATIGTLHITGNTVLDFGNSSASTLNATTLLIDAGVTLTIINWVNTTDYFYAQNWTGATANVTGSTPMNQITFSGYSAGNSHWQSYDNQVTPVPEPATYGAAMAGLMLAWLGIRRRFGRRPAQA